MILIWNKDLLTFLMRLLIFKQLLLELSFIFWQFFTKLHDFLKPHKSSLMKFSHFLKNYHLNDSSTTSVRMKNTMNSRDRISCDGKRKYIPF